MHSPAPYSGELSARLLEFERKGRDEGAENRPPSNAIDADQTEAEVLLRAQQYVLEQHRAFGTVVVESRNVAHSLHQALPTLKARVESAIADAAVNAEVDSELAGHKHKLATFAEARMRAHTDLKYFRDLHEIKIEAVYPTSHVWHFAIVAVLALLETIANAFFYENAQGLLGGFMVALGVAVFNMGTALVLGMLFRYKNLNDTQSRAAGWGCLIGFVGLTIYCNALFATFRAEYQLLADPSDATALRSAFGLAAENAWRVFTLQMNFGDFLSFILFGLGVLLSSFAFYKGYTFDDRYPNHGKLDRKYKAAREAEQRCVEEVREQLKAYLEGKRQTLRALPQEITRVSQDAANGATRLRHAQSELHAQQSRIQQDCHLALQAYRSANTAVRPTPAPAYFANYPTVHRETDHAALEVVLNELGAVHRSAEQLRDQSLGRLHERLNLLQQDIAQVLSRTFDDFVKRAEADAAERIDSMTGTVRRASRETALRA